MCLRQVVDFLSEGSVVELFNPNRCDQKRIIYRLKSVPSVNVIVLDVSNAMGDLLEDGEWPWYIKDHFKDDLEEIDVRPSGLPVENYQIK